MRKNEHLLTEHIMLLPHNCMACWSCIAECPRQVIGKVQIGHHKHAHIDNSPACLGCGKCIKVCRHNAIELRSTLEPVSTEIRQNKVRHHRGSRGIKNIELIS